MLCKCCSCNIKVGDKIDLSAVQTETITVSAKKIVDGEYDESKETDATAEVISTNIKETTISGEGLYAITISATGYASWTTTVYVESAN